MARTVWYPGHMAKGLKQLRALSEKIDIVIEVRDARAPEVTASAFSSEIAKFKPLWVILSKKDLADDKATKEWLSHYKKKGINAWAFNLRRPSFGGFLRALSKLRPSYRELRLVVVGVPNVGKSLFLNQLVGKKASPVGGVPGITRGVSWYKGKGFMVADSPGIVDPKAGAAVHRCLAWLAGSRSDVIGGYHNIALDFLAYLEDRNLLKVALASWDIEITEGEPEKVLESIGKRLGCLAPGGSVDMERAGKLLLDSFSAGKLGKITLELPEQPFCSPEEGK